jgi:hypothetical protein
MIKIAEQMKCKLLLTKNRLLKIFHPLYQKSIDALYRTALWIRPYSYDSSRYAGEFITRSAMASTPRPLNRVIYCFWTGENELSPKRHIGLESLQRESGVKVILVTPNNLDTFIHPDMPLHPAYKHLSLVHRSDYLRCYFMNFWGGGYSDIKSVCQPWTNAFDRLEQAADKWMLGYREIASNMTSVLPGKLGADVRRNYSLLVGNGAFIMKAGTPLTNEWYARLMEKMDEYAPDLARNPGNERGNNSGYPIPWIDILGNILPPLELKYHHRLIQDNSVCPDFFSYR